MNWDAGLLTAMASLAFVSKLIISTWKWAQNAEIDRLIKWSIMHIFNETEPP